MKYTRVHVEGAIHFITVAKSKMYCMAVKSMGWGLTICTKSNTCWTPCQYILLFARLIKCIALKIFLTIMTQIKDGAYSQAFVILKMLYIKICYIILTKMADFIQCGTLNLSTH